VTAFVLAECPRRSRGSAKLLVTALRSLLGFLHVDGVLAESLIRSVPSVAGWRLAGLPRGLEAGQARRLLAGCDRRTTVGRRDFAILTLLVRLALRRGEVARLELCDIDWRAGEIVIRGKGDRQERLPLPTDVGEAVAGYLRRGRPASAEGRCVFVRVKAPHRALTPGGVTNVVLAAGRRAGLGQIAAHRLRHTAATEMLRAGATLPEIGQCCVTAACSPPRSTRRSTERRCGRWRGRGRDVRHEPPSPGTRRLFEDPSRARLQARARRQAAPPVPRLSRADRSGDRYQRERARVGDAPRRRERSLVGVPAVHGARLRRLPAQPRPGPPGAAGRAAAAPVALRDPLPVPTKRSRR